MQKNLRKIEIVKLIEGWDDSKKLYVLNYALSQNEQISTGVWTTVGINKMLFGYSANNHGHKFNLITARESHIELIFYRLCYASAYMGEAFISRWRAKHFPKGVVCLKCGNDNVFFNHIREFKKYQNARLLKKYHHSEYKNRKEPKIINISFHTIGNGYALEYEFSFKCFKYESGWSEYIHQDEGEKIQDFIVRCEKHMQKVTLKQRKS